MGDSSLLAVPVGLEQEDIGTLLNTKSYRQYCSMRSDIVAGKCTFCPPDPKKNVIVHSTECWHGWRNPFPQEHTRDHFIFATQEHFTDVKRLPLKAMEEIGIILAWVATEYSLPGGMLALRFGDPAYNAGSIRHQHLNIFVPDGTGELRIPIAKKPDDVAKKRIVIGAFEKMYQGTLLEQLSEEERLLLSDKEKNYLG